MKILQKNNDLIFSVQNQPPLEVKEVYSSLLISCGGIINSAFLELLDKDISEVLFYIYLYIDVQKKINPQTSTAEKWGVAGAFNNGE